MLLVHPSDQPVAGSALRSELPWPQISTLHPAMGGSDSGNGEFDARRGFATWKEEAERLQ